MKSVQIKITYDNGRVIELSPDVEFVQRMAMAAEGRIKEYEVFNDVDLRAMELAKVLQG